MIFTVTLNPAVDKTITISKLNVGGVNRVEEVRQNAGGKGINVSKTISMLGGSTIAMGILGGETGSFIESALNQMGIKHDFCKVNAPTRTNIKIVDRAAQISTDINERGASMDADTFRTVFENLKRQAKAGDTVVFAGSVPPGTRADLLKDWTLELKKLGIQVFMDTSGEPLRQGIEAAPALIKPNKDELEELVGCELRTESDLISAAKNLIARGIAWVVVSLGSDGALFVSEDRTLRGYGLKVPVFSAVGAGDSMVAAIAYGMERDLPLHEIAALAIAVSAAHVADCPDAERTTLMEQLREQVCIKER